MRTLVTALYAVGILIGSAQAEGFADFAVDEETLESCRFLLGPQTTPEDTVRSVFCGRSVLDYLLDTGLGSENDPDTTTQERVACGAELLLAAGVTDATVTQALNSAGFPDKCM